MLSLMRAQSRSAQMAVIYITIGVLVMIWTGVWFYYDSAPEGWHRPTQVGLFLSGLAVTVIGLLIGQIGGSAKDADNTVGVAPAGPIVAPVAAPAMAPVAQPMAQPGAYAQPGGPPVV